MRDREAISIIVLLASFASGCCFCPRVSRIGEPSPPAGRSPLPPSFGVLFVPSGFARQDLPAYRVATEELARRVLAEGPFGPASRPGDHEIRVEFFRIDLVGRHPGQDCSDERSNQLLRSPAPSRGAARGTPLDSIRRRASSLPLDLGAEQVRCDELSIGAVGEVAALSLAQCVPGVDVVVIVVNVDGALGFTRQLAGAGDIGLAVVGVDLTDSLDGIDGGGGDFVSSAAVDTLRHELGHTLGLLDEYYCDPADERCSERHWPGGERFRGGRNVWKEGPLTEPLRCSDCGSVEGDLREIPWRSCFASSPLCCQDFGGQVVITSTCDNIAERCGLWEGAYYRKQGYFRSHQVCLMEENGKPFCRVCLNLLEAALRKHSRPHAAAGQETRP